MRGHARHVPLRCVPPCNLCLTRLPGHQFGLLPASHASLRHRLWPCCACRPPPLHSPHENAHRRPVSPLCLADLGLGPQFRCLLRWKRDADRRIRQHRDRHTGRARGTAHLLHALVSPGEPSGDDGTPTRAIRRHARLTLPPVFVPPPFHRLKIGVPVTIVSVAMANVWLLLRFCL